MYEKWELYLLQKKRKRRDNQKFRFLRGRQMKKNEHIKWMDGERFTLNRTNIRTANDRNCTAEEYIEHHRNLEQGERAKEIGGGGR